SSVCNSTSWHTNPSRLGFKAGRAVGGMRVAKSAKKLAPSQSNPTTTNPNTARPDASGLP
ncbi:MAG: hypothetical protein EBZ78_06480, partial [Verrucomicrobia bacterium]|nr:hypothetical protein [Verrucomicrobiota bacterium]